MVNIKIIAISKSLLNYRIERNTMSLYFALDYFSRYNPAVISVRDYIAENFDDDFEFASASLFKHLGQILKNVFANMLEGSFLGISSLMSLNLDNSP